MNIDNVHDTGMDENRVSPFNKHKGISLDLDANSNNTDKTLWIVLKYNIINPHYLDIHP